MVTAVRTRTLTVICAALSVISVASILGVSVLVDMYTRRQVDLAARVLTFATSGHDSANPMDLGEFSGALPRNATVIFAAPDRSEALWSSSGSDATPSDIDALLRRCLEVPDGVDTFVGEYPVRARLLRFAAPVAVVDRETGWRSEVDVAVIALTARSASKLMWVVAATVAATAVLTMIGSAGAITVLVRRTMAPLTRLADAVRSLGPRPSASALRRGVGDGFEESATMCDAIADLVDRRARAEEELREFIDNTSHELRTPLTKIQGWSELYFQRPATAAHTERAMQSIVEECDRMRSMVDQLSLLARARELPDMAAEAVDVCALCRTVAEDVAVLAPDLLLRSNIPDHPVIVAGHADRITQVLRNVIGNSVLHAGPGVTLAIRVIDGTDVVRIELSDNGCGIPAEQHSRLFTRHYSANARSSGLGLAIVRAIMTSYGGDVTMQSAPKQGTVVTLRFPISSKP